MTIAQNLNLDAIQNTSGLPIWYLYVQPVFFITIILNYIFPIAGILLLIYLVLGGFQLMFSRGDPKAMEGAKGKITNALIGFVIVVIAFFIVQLLAQLLNLQGTFFGQTFGAK